MSFRFRLFVATALVVGAVLALVTGLGWRQVLAYETERLDERLCMEARRFTGPLPRHLDAARLHADVALKLRLASTEQLMMRADDEGRDPARAAALRWDARVDSAALAWRDADLRPGPSGGPPPGEGEGPCRLTSFDRQGASWRAALVQSAGVRSVVAADLAAVRSELQAALRRALLLVVPLALVLTALAAWALSALTMRPVNRLRDAMRQVTPQALDSRLPRQGEDREFQDLIDAYNTMLARLEASFHQASRFSADAAHELRTPLTILQGRVERALQRAETPALRQELGELLDEVGRLAGITRKLLLLSQADAGKLALHCVPVDLSRLLADRLADAQMMLDGQTLRSAIAPGLVVQADELLLGQLLNNLIGNAVRHGLPEGWIEVRAVRGAGGVAMEFANACAPLDAQRRQHLFDRFFRGDAAHGRRVDGTGLGLSLAREIARAHGGDLTLLPGAPDELRLRLWWPGG